MIALTKFAAALALVALVANRPTLAADTPGIQINREGVFQDYGVWLYQNADGTFAFGDKTSGTNEVIVMPSPHPSPGGVIVGLEHLHHTVNTGAIRCTSRCSRSCLQTS